MALKRAFIILLSQALVLIGILAVCTGLIGLVFAVTSSPGGSHPFGDLRPLGIQAFGVSMLIFVTCIAGYRNLSRWESKLKAVESGDSND